MTKYIKNTFNLTWDRTHSLRLYAVVMFAVVYICSASKAYANACVDELYSDVLQVHSSYEGVVFGYNANIQNGGDSQLTAGYIYHDPYSSVNSCGSSPCQASGTYIAPKQLPQFQTTLSDINTTVLNDTSDILGDLGQREYGTINVESNATLYVEQVGHSPQDTYIINALNLSTQSKLELRAGHYWIKTLNMESDSEITVVGDGTVNLFVYDPFNPGWSTGFNLNTDGSPANPNQLLLISYSNTLFNASGFSGFIYSSGQFHSGGNSYIAGGVLATKVLLGGDSYAYHHLPENENVLSPLCAPEPEIDTDQDGVNDNLDQCDGTPADTAVDASGCSLTQADSDDDGVNDATDQCPNTPAGIAVDSEGCSLEVLPNCRLQLFADGLQISNSFGDIQFGHNAAIYGNPDSVLNTPSLSVSNGSNLLSCDGTHCSASGNPTSPHELLPFEHSNVNNYTHVGSQQQITLGQSNERHFGTIDTQDATINIDAGFSVDDVMYIDQLVVGYQSTLNLRAGTYWVRSLTIGDHSTVNIVGPGSVRLYVQQSLTPAYNSTINEGGDPNQLTLVTYGDLDFNNTVISGYINAQGSVSFGYQASLTGALVASSIWTNSEVSIHYQAPGATTEMGQLCHWDLDLDQDGYLNIEDTFPLDPYEWADTDGDGVGDNGDAFPNDPNESADTDGDGYGDNSDAFINDPNEWLDTDGDGYGDNSDAFINDPSEWLDTDGDGYGDNSDAFTNDPNEWADADADGVGDNGDEFPNDPNESADTDGDGYGDNSDAFPNDPIEWTDADSDGYGDNGDVFPNDPNEWSDIDGDGIGDNADPDRDNDGISNDYEVQAGTDPNDSTSTPPDLDGDAIPDSLDDDMDGDGTDNQIEIDNGTDPADATDYPDFTPPIINFVNPNDSTLEVSSVLVTVNASDAVQPHFGIASVLVNSSRYPNAPFSLILDGSVYRGEIPLSSGINELNIIAVDQSGNESAAELLIIERISPPSFANVTPVDGQILTTPTFTLKGEVHSFRPLTGVQFSVNEWTITPVGTSVKGVYAFELKDIPLSIGNNSFELVTITSGASTSHTLNLEYLPEGAEQLPAPEITLFSPRSDYIVKGGQFLLAVQIASFGGPMLQATINGVAVDIPDSENILFNYSQLMSFAPENEIISFDISATDTLGKTATQTITLENDNSEPEIIITSPVLDAGNVNNLSYTPLEITGTVMDTRLSGFRINDQAITLEPTATEGLYEFTASIHLPRDTQVPLNFSARDRAGHQKNIEYTVYNTAAHDIQPLAPSANASFVSDGTNDIEVQVIARTTPLLGGETVRVLVNGEATALNAADTLASANINLPPTAGTLELVFQIINGTEVTAETRRRVQVEVESNIDLQVVRIEPINRAEHIEPMATVELYFNKEVNLAELSLSVKETLNGYTYVNEDGLGQDFLNAKGYVLKQVNRNSESVPGAIDVLPGNKAIAFTPSRYMGFGADVVVELSHNGNDLSRTQFNVRALPTFVNGSLRDQFGQPLSQIQVSLPELGRTAYTNKDGGFAFGYQETGQQLIAGGRYTLVVNKNFANPDFGTHVQTVKLQQNRINEIQAITLQELNKNIPFSQITSTGVNHLAGGDLILDLSDPDASLFYLNGGTSGRLHTQFLPKSHLSVRSFEQASPHWIFSNQPRGIEVEGPVGLSIAMPKLNGNYDYLPDIFKYVVLLGYNAEREVLEPVGVGKIENHAVKSMGDVTLSTLDYIGYALVHPDNTELLEAVANGEKSLLQLKAELQ